MKQLFANRRNWLTDQSVLYLMAVPCVLLMLAFNYVPLFGWAYAFFDYFPGYKLFDTEFVGFKYFQMAFGDPEVFAVLRNTLVMSGLGLLVSPFPVIFAIVLSELKWKRFQKLIQVLTTFPNFISWVIVYAVFMAFFSYDDGFVNKMIAIFGWKPVNPLAENSIVWYFQTGVGLWKGLGFSAIIYFATIVGIDQEMYEAAAIDGAGRYHRILHITIPGIMPTFIVLLLLSIGNLLNNGFEQFYVFYNPMVHENIMVLELYLYKIGIELGSFPLSTAVGISKSIIGVILLFGTNMLSKKVRGESII